MQDFEQKLTEKQKQAWMSLPDEESKKAYMLQEGVPVSDEIYLQSVYAETYNMENPWLSGLVQSGEFALL